MESPMLLLKNWWEIGLSCSQGCISYPEHHPMCSIFIEGGIKILILYCNLIKHTYPYTKLISFL
jgi:hypothetical protein